MCVGVSSDVEFEYTHGCKCIIFLQRVFVVSRHGCAYAFIFELYNYCNNMRLLYIERYKLQSDVAHCIQPHEMRYLFLSVDSWRVLSD